MRKMFRQKLSFASQKKLFEKFAICVVTTLLNHSNIGIYCVEKRFIEFELKIKLTLIIMNLRAGRFIFHAYRNRQNVT